MDRCDEHERLFYDYDYVQLLTTISLIFQERIIYNYNKYNIIACKKDNYSSCSSLD